jgi:thiamine kinase-like enzyme
VVASVVPRGEQRGRVSDVDALLDRLSCLHGKPRHVTELAGGLTNRNLHVTTPDDDVVVRISSNGGMLAIDRDAEYENSRAAAESGAAPKVVEYARDDNMLVVEFIDGDTLTEADVADSGTLQRIAEAVRTLHNGPRFVRDFDMFDIQRSYLATVQSKGFRLPPRYLEFMPQIDRMRDALTAHPVGAVPCNNDLLAANFMDDGERIWIIDYEYSGNNDPCFELGNIWSESTLPLDLLDLLVSEYFGANRPSMVARARLLGLMSKYGWTLWASIQHASSDLEFDFWSWGMEKYDRAVEEFDGPDFEGLLATAAAPG